VQLTESGKHSNFLIWN